MSFDEQPDGDIHGECAFEIHSLQQQLASCQAALADTEALEIGTGERLAKVEQRLAAANGLIAEQNKLGKERQEWALHTSDVIRSLNQQLAEALEQNLVLSKQTDHTILDLSNYVDSLEQQLAGAIAACKQKDESIEAAHNGLRWWMDAFPLHVTEADNKEMLKLVKALTIQPDDSALKAWLGQPVGEVKKHTGSLKDMAIIVWTGKQPEEGTKLYYPKGLK